MTWKTRLQNLMDTEAKPRYGAENYKRISFKFSLPDVCAIKLLKHFPFFSFFSHFQTKNFFLLTQTFAFTQPKFKLLRKRLSGINPISVDSAVSLAIPLMLINQVIKTSSRPQVSTNWRHSDHLLRSWK